MTLCCAVEPKQPFDRTKAAFYLVAAVIGLHGLVVLAGVGTCLYYAAAIVDGAYRCDAGNKLTELLSAALAAALAFAGGFTRK